MATCRDLTVGREFPLTLFRGISCIGTKMISGKGEFEALTDVSASETANVVQFLLHQHFITLLCKSNESEFLLYTVGHL